MCSVSYIADDWNATRSPAFLQAIPATQIPNQFVGPSRAEFDALKAELQELKLLLLAAKRYDDKTGQKDCEMADKIALMRRIGEAFGVDLEDVFAVAKPTP